MQQATLDSTLEACRWLYNYLLSRKIQSKEDMQFAFTELKEQKSWLNNYHSKMLQMVVHKIDTARKALMELRKKGYEAGVLSVIKRGEYNTFTYNQSGFKLERHGDTDLLWLSKIGYIPIRLHRPVNGTVKQVTITKKAGRWYACMVVNERFMMPVIDFRKSAGIDVGIKNYAYDSDDNATPNPENIKKMLKPLIRAQRKVSRRVKGSNNYKKAKRWYQIVHERIANRRRDFLHKLSTYYANKYDVVFMERLRINNMVKNHKLACGLVLDRDYNASLNILKKGLQVLPMEDREVTPVEILTGSRKQEASALRHW